MRGRVVSLDRGFPLVRLDGGQELRAELSTTIKKSADSQVAVGDFVQVGLPDSHDKAIIERIEPRRTEIARVKRVGREGQVRRQVLAANVDSIILCHALTTPLDLRLLARQICATVGAGCRPVVTLTKPDLVSEALRAEVAEQVRAVFPEVLQAAPGPQLIGVGQTALLLGESGVGKSTLVNALCGLPLQATGAVRERDDKGRHTTVARRIVDLPGAGQLIDAPGLRTLQLIDAEGAIAATFADVVEAAARCKFTDCTHTHEPGCAVRGTVGEARLAMYVQLRQFA